MRTHRHSVLCGADQRYCTSITLRKNFRIFSGILVIFEYHNLEKNTITIMPCFLVDPEAQIAL
jgi:hypothetical protein